MIETLRKLLLGLVLAGMTTCSGNPGPQPPTPPTPTPPPASGVKFSELLLRTDGVKLVRPNQPLTFKPFGAVPCCPDTPPELWPMIGPNLMDFYKGYGANMFHFRLGPFYGDADHESAWTGIGGAYAGGPGSDWNPVFFAKVRELLDHAGNLGANVEIVPIDTWYCKHASSSWGDQQMPWPQADIDACGITPSPEQEKFIRKVVQETGLYANVIYLTDNEGGEIRGTKREWYEWVLSVIRDEEQKLAVPVVHLVGTNNTDFCDIGVDYCATHARAALVEPIAGKHTENNERNPAFSPAQEASNFEAARAVGLHYWFWRADQTEAQEKATLELIKGEVPVGCFPPAEEDPLWVTPPIPGVVGTSMRPAVEAAKAEIPERCGTDHQGSLNTLELLGAKLREQGYCAGKSADSVFIKTPEGKWQEFHAVSFATGCWANDPAQLPKNTWTYGGASPTACTGGTEAVDQISCKEVQATNHIWDCTPKINGRPVRPEGDPEREVCEREACGGTPTYSINPPLELFPRDNPYQFRLSGTGTGLLVSTCPRTSGDLTGQVVTQ